MPKADPYAGYSLVESAPPTEAPRAELVPQLEDVVPDLKQHTPDQFAGLTGQQAVARLHAQNLQPTIETITGIENEALKSAIDYHKSLAIEQERKQQELALRQAAITSGTLAAEEQTRAKVELAKQQAQQQWAQGPSAVAAAAAQPGGFASGQIKGMDRPDQKDFAGYIGAFHTIKNLHGLFQNMVDKTVGAGGELHSLLGLTTPIVNMTSDEARTYRAYAESSLVPLAKGVMGDAATSAAKDKIQENMLSGLPGITDNLASGGHKIYALLDRNYNEMKTQRDILHGNGVDTSSIDSQILDAQDYMQRPEVQALNPFRKEAPVQQGVSDQSKAVMDNVNAGANAGIDTQPLGTGWSMGGQPAPQQPPPQQPDQSQQPPPQRPWSGFYGQ
jgi:hypothetical protein